MKVSIYKCAGNNSQKVVIEAEQTFELPRDICKGEWIFEKSMELQATDPDTKIGASAAKVLNDIDLYGYFKM